MSNKVQTYSARLQSGKGRQRPLPLVLLAIIASLLLVALLQTYKYRASNGDAAPAVMDGTITPQPVSPLPVPIDSAAENYPAPARPVISESIPPRGAVEETAAGDPLAATYELDENALKPAETEPSDKQIPGESAPSTSPAMAAQEVKTFFQQLDQRAYLKAYQIAPSSQKHFAQMVQKILDRPPVVSGEARDLFTILQNTAHFFRIIGRENTQAIKTILDHEGDSIEEMFVHLSTLSESPHLLNEHFGIRLNRDSLYDYAGFFLSTIGGRLYLFRRDASTRLLVSYYAVLLVYEADQQGVNRHGIDLRQQVDAVIAELENTGTMLHHRERYLDKLYDIREQYL